MGSTNSGTLKEKFGPNRGDSSISKEAGLFIFNHVARDLAYEIGLDRLFIKYDSVVDEYAIEAGKRFGRKNMVIIEGSKAGSSVIIERDISKSLKLRVGRHMKEHRRRVSIYFLEKDLSRWCSILDLN